MSEGKTTPPAPTYSLKGDRWCNSSIYVSYISCGVHQLYIGSGFKLDQVYERNPDGTVKVGYEDCCLSLMKKVNPPDGSAPKVSVPRESSLRPGTCAFYVFSDADIYGNGIGVAAYVSKHNLGTVTESVQPARNPNSGHTIRVWSWAIDREAVRRHLFSKAGWTLPEDQPVVVSSAGDAEVLRRVA